MQHACNVVVSPSRAHEPATPVFPELSRDPRVRASRTGRVRRPRVDRSGRRQLRAHAGDRARPPRAAQRRRVRQRGLQRQPAASALAGARGHDSAHRLRHPAGVAGGARADGARGHRHLWPDDSRARCREGAAQHRDPATRLHHAERSARAHRRVAGRRHHRGGRLEPGGRAGGRGRPARHPRLLAGQHPPGLRRRAGAGARGAPGGRPLRTARCRAAPPARRRARRRCTRPGDRRQPGDAACARAVAAAGGPQPGRSAGRARPAQRAARPRARRRSGVASRRARLDRAAPRDRRTRHLDRRDADAVRRRCDPRSRQPAAHPAAPPANAQAAAWPPCRALPLRRPARPQRGLLAHAAGGPPLCVHRTRDPDHRRKRHRQGAAGASDPSGQRRARRGRSLPSTAPPFRKGCWRANCSATRRAPSPARAVAASAACSRPRTPAACSSTRSATCRWRCRRACCACCRKARSSGWARRRGSRSMCA